MNWVTATSGFDEVFERAGRPASHYAAAHLASSSPSPREDVDRRERLQKLALMNQGITFTVYGEKEGLERIFPFDFVPRIIPAAEWKHDPGRPRPAHHRRSTCSCSTSTRTRSA